MREGFVSISKRGRFSDEREHENDKRLRQSIWSSSSTHSSRRQSTGRGVGWYFLLLALASILLVQNVSSFSIVPLSRIILINSFNLNIIRRRCWYSLHDRVKCFMSSAAGGKESDLSSSSSSSIHGNETYDFWEEKLSLKSFNMDLQNLAIDDPRKAQDALEIMEDLHRKQKPMTVLPDAACYTTVIEGWLDIDRFDAANALLHRMEELQDQYDEGDGVDAPMSLTELTYLLVIQGWANDSKNDISGESAEQAEELMRHMQARGFSPNVKIWSIVLDGWCKRAGVARGAMKRAEALLNEMEAAYDNVTTTSVPPNVLTYTSFIGGLSRSKERDMAQRAESVLERMQKHGVSADAVAYTSVLNCWSKTSFRREREMAATRSLHILAEMERLYAKEMYHAKPSHITYATAISAIGNSLDPKAPELAEEVLERMNRLHRKGAIANLKPTTQTYNAVLLALSRAPTDNKLRYARRAEQILYEMAKSDNKDSQPDVRTWAAVLRAWSRSGTADAAENAQRVLDKLEDMYRNGETTVRPNFVCYTTVMGAWGRSRRRGSLDKMESILRHMEDTYEETLEASIRPNTVSYVTAIDAIVRRNDRDMAIRAQRTVDRMTRLYAKELGHVRPTKTIFNCLIHAYSKSREKDAASQAEKIFNWMDSQYCAGDDLVKPDEVSLCAVLNAWANQGTTISAERAQQIWNRMKSISAPERGFDLTIMMPNIVIKAIARSNDPDGVKKAEHILEDIEEDYRNGKSNLRPDVTTASSVINAAAYYTGNSEGRAQALEIALRTFRKISEWKDEQPNNITFGTLFKAIDNLMPYGDYREDMVRTLFDQCCEGGNVDGFVLSQLRRASPQLFRDLVEEPRGLGGPGEDISISSVLKNIPSEWCANVVE